MIIMDVEKVKQVIEKIRPQLQMDGGDIELISCEDDGTVKVRLMGIKQFVPEVKQVINVA